MQHGTLPLAICKKCQRFMRIVVDGNSSSKVAPNTRDNKLWLTGHCHKNYMAGKDKQTKNLIDAQLKIFAKKPIQVQEEERKQWARWSQVLMTARKKIASSNKLTADIRTRAPENILELMGRKRKATQSKARCEDTVVGTNTISQLSKKSCKRSNSEVVGTATINGMFDARSC